MVAVTHPGWAYDIETHQVLATRAADQSTTLDSVLRTHLRFPSGRETSFSGKTVREWVAFGAGSEDQPFTRVLRHFHNPLRPWNQAGLTILGFQIGQSSVLWQQNLHQESAVLAGSDGSWAWPNARTSYFQALTSQSKLARDTAFAQTFRALGQTMHLVQDATVPAHVRNDPHLVAVNPDWYEDWVEKIRSRTPNAFQALLERGAIVPPTSIFAATDNPEAPAPVARLIDTDQFLGTNGEVLARPDIGTAEYTNGNFLSRDTLFTDFLLPRTTSLSNVPIIEPEGSRFRRYFRKELEGEVIEHFVTEGMLFNSLQAALKGSFPPAGGWTLTDRVQQDYAAKLIPRAVGYSAALLDHFFRGDFELRVTGATPDRRPILTITNRTLGERAAGTLLLYYDTGSEEERYRLDEWTADISLAPNASADLPALPPPLPDRPPTEPGRYLLVFKGRLGEEPEAVVATWFTFWIGHFGTVWLSYSCTRLPSNQFDCATANGSAGPSPLVPDADGRGMLDGLASESQSYTVGPGLYQTDSPQYLYLNATTYAQQWFYLYREGTGPTMTVTVGAPGCSVRWGTLAGGPESLSADEGPRIQNFRGAGGPLQSGESTFTVGPGSLLFLFYAPSALPDPPIGAGTSQRSTSCSVVGVRFGSD